MSGYYDLHLLNDNYPAGAYRFYGDGRCYYYKYNHYTGERYLFDVDDVIENNTWSTNGDTIVIRGYRYKIVSALSDSVVLKAFIGRDRILVKSKHQE